MFNFDFAYPQRLFWALILFLVISTLSSVFRTRMLVYIPGIESFLQTWKPKRHIDFLRIFAIVSLFCAAVLIARPVSYVSQMKTKESVREIMFLLDISGSTLSVLPKVIEDIDALVEEFYLERVGLAVFAGAPYVLAPLSENTKYFHQKLEKLLDERDWILQNDPSGTAIGEALQVTTDRFTLLDVDENQVRSIFMITDGANNSGLPPEDLLPVLEKKSIQLFIVDISDDQNASSLRGLARKTGGTYFSDPSGATGIATEYVREQDTTDTMITLPPVRIDQNRAWSIVCFASFSVYFVGYLVSRRRRLQL